MIYLLLELWAFNVKAFQASGKVTGTLVHIAKTRKIVFRPSFGDKKKSVEKAYFKVDVSEVNK